MLDIVYTSVIPGLYEVKTGGSEASGLELLSSHEQNCVPQTRTLLILGDLQHVDWSWRQGDEFPELINGVWGGIYPYCSHRKTPMMKVTWMNCLQLKESGQKAHAHVWHSPSVWTVSAHRSQRGSQWPTWAIVTFNLEVWNLCEMVAAAAAAVAVAAAAAAAAAISKHIPSLL